MLPWVDRRTDSDDLGDRPRGPFGRIGALPLGRHPREVALEAGRRADDELPGGGVAQVRKRVRNSARREHELAVPVAELASQVDANRHLVLPSRGCSGSRVGVLPRSGTSRRASTATRATAASGAATRNTVCTPSITWARTAGPSASTF